MTLIIKSARSQAVQANAAKAGSLPIYMAAVADTLLAVAFAGALTRGLVALPQGVAAALPWLLALALAVALRGGAGGLGLWWAARRSQRLKRALRRRTLAAILNARAGFGRLTGEASASVVDEIEALDGYFVRYAPARAQAAFGPLLILIVAAFASPIAAGLMAATLAPFIALMILAGGAAASASRRQLDALSKLSGVFADRVGALPVILAFQAEPRVTAQIAAAAQGVSDRTLSVLRIAFVSSAGLEFFAALSVAMIAVYAGFSLLGLLPFRVPETLTFERAFFVLALAPEFYAPMRRLAAAYHEKQLGEAAAARLDAVLATPQAPAPKPVLVPSAPGVRYRAVVVSFADDPGQRIGPIDFEAPAGGVFALMGPTGSGKTTLLRLLVGEAKLAAGEVELAGYRLTESGSFAPIIAWSSQAPILLPGTIAHNIGFGRPGASPAQIAEVAQRVGLESALSKRAGGLGAEIDERGSGLSGGERRRIGIARALLSLAPVLVLDEPTADLDATSEQALIAAIRQAASGRTTLIATHSERVAAIADRVVRL